MTKLQHSVPVRDTIRTLEHYVQPDWASPRVRTFVSGTSIFGFRYTDVNKLVVCGYIMPDWEREAPGWMSIHWWRVRVRPTRKWWHKALLYLGGKEIETWEP